MSLLSSSFKSVGGTSRVPVVAAGLAFVLLTTLGGCSGVGRALGVGKRPPDEFTVVGRAPLVVPPDFNLMPPKDAKHGEIRKSDVDPHKMAMEALFPAGRTDVPIVMPATSDDAVSGGSAAPAASSPEATPVPETTPEQK